MGVVAHVQELDDLRPLSGLLQVIGRVAQILEVLRRGLPRERLRPGRRARPVARCVRLVLDMGRVPQGWGTRGSRAVALLPPRPAPPPIARVPADRNASDTPSTSSAALASPSPSANSFRVRTDWREPTGRPAVSSRRARVTRPAAAALWTLLGSRARPSLARPSACSNPGDKGYSLAPRDPLCSRRGRWDEAQRRGAFDPTGGSVKVDRLAFQLVFQSRLGRNRRRVNAAKNDT